MVHGYVPFKIESDNPALHSRWLLLPKIENSSIVHCCLFIYQNELKYIQQLYSNEYFNMYFGFFCEIFHSANLYRFKSSSLKPLNQIWHGWSLGDPLLSVSYSPHLLFKMVAVTKNRNSLIVLLFYYKSK